MVTDNQMRERRNNASFLDLKNTGVLDLDGDQPLGSQVYNYLRELLRTEKLKPGTCIQTGTLAKQLGVSKTPLRDALIQLQAEGFLKIRPQRGVIINTLGEKELTELTQVLGGLESKAMMLAFPRITKAKIAEMRRINERLFQLLPHGKDKYKEYNKLNIAFHDVFLDVCSNEFMVNQIRNLKERMYHFPDRDYGDVWRNLNVKEHEKIIAYIEEGDDQMAADFLRDIHWTFDLRKPTLKIRK